MQQRHPVLAFVRKWISPVVELTVAVFIARQFYTGVRKAHATRNGELDFVMHCRAILKPVFGSAGMATIVASEVAVFYYLFARSRKADGVTRLSTYKESGSRMILFTFFLLFMIETTGMHFVITLWNPALAWMITGLGSYTCLQLLAHIRAIKARPVVVAHSGLLLRNGLLGGEVQLPYSNIERIECTRKIPGGEATVKLALIKGLENHNVVLYLHQPVVVTKAFGITRTASVLLLSVDNTLHFADAVERAKTVSGLRG